MEGVDLGKLKITVISAQNRNNWKKPKINEKYP